MIYPVEKHVIFPVDLLLLSVISEFTQHPLPQDPETHESRWVFSVAGKEASQSFLLVGTVKEPKVGDLPSQFAGLLLWLALAEIS